MPITTNELGYPILCEGTRSAVFGDLSEKPVDENKLGKAQARYESLGIPVPVKYSEGLYEGEVPVPELLGSNIIEHFEAAAESMVGDYVREADRFANSKLPEIPGPENLVFQPGWTRYEPLPSEEGGWKISRVDYPQEKVFTYDTETYVSGGAYPIIATCVSLEATYVWLARELVNPDTPVEDWDSYKLVPIGKGRTIIGHNISYDRVRCQEAYSLESEDPENFYIDTLSMNIAVSGLAGGQRWLHVLAGKDRELMTEEEKKKLRIGVNWLDKGAMNSLVACYNYHVHLEKEWLGLPTKKLESDDKKARNIFVTAECIHEIHEVLEESVAYAVKDAFYTAELFQSLWPKYQDSSPSMVAMSGHYLLAGSRIPLVPDWEDWKDSCESVWGKNNDRMTEICVNLAKKAYEEWLPLYQKDLEEVKGLYEGPEKKFPTFLKSLDADGYQWRNLSDAWVDKDPWLRQLDWNPCSYTRKYAHVPKWYKPFLAKDFTVSGKNRSAHILLRLTYEGQPVVWTSDRGWCF